MAPQKNTRQRDSVGISENGKLLVREALSQKRWTQDGWATKAYVSISTIQRLLNGKRIDRGSFNAAFEVLGLNPDEFIAPRDDQQDSATPPVPSLIPKPPDQSHTQHSDIFLQRFMITGTFSPNKLAEIEVALIHLEKLLQANATFTLVPDHNHLAVSGSFSEDKKPEIEVALMHLEKLLLEHTRTIY
ncbi:helix-turn-helix domain-containing protein [Phormidium nigroviride]